MMHRVPCPPIPRWRALGLAAALLGAVTAGLPAQQAPAVSRIAIEPASLTLEVNGTTRLAPVAYDAAGNRVEIAFLFFSTSRRNLAVDSTGRVTAIKPGSYGVIVMPFDPDVRRVNQGQSGVRASVEITVPWPAIQVVAIQGDADRLYAGTTVRLTASVRDASGALRNEVPVRWTSDNERVLAVSRFGEVTALAPGSATVLAQAEGVTGSRKVRVEVNPVRALDLTASAEDARTGDVVHFQATARDRAGREVSGVPVAFSVAAMVEDTVIAPEAPAQIDGDGAFVAQRAGDYTIIATAGPVTARKTVSVSHRHRSQRIAVAAGQGGVRDEHTSDLWVWTGGDGRDYAVTGTWGARGVAYFWDVTDPARPERVDSVQVDARTVNDVKVDPERGICVITREGASSRRNGLVVLDCANPRAVTVLATFDDGLWGGVHNVFVWNRHVFAINAGRRFDIISIEDPRAPRRVGWFELETPGHGIHDVWVVDGIAYASQWQDGVILVDVGNGVAGGSLSHPVEIGRYAYPIGATHSAFPYRARDGKFYVFVGDEQFPYGLHTEGKPAEAGGYIHVVDFTDVKRPKEVARYQIPEAGPHNFWLANDTLYVAYYNAGLRVVDISGELKGNLYDQERELARFFAFDPHGVIPNAPMAWGPQPHKGHVFFSDWNSGLWAVKLPEAPKPAVP